MKDAFLLEKGKFVLAPVLALFSFVEAREKSDDDGGRGPEEAPPEDHDQEEESSQEREK